MIYVFFILFFRQAFIGAPTTAGASRNKQQVPLLALWGKGTELVP